MKSSKNRYIDTTKTDYNKQPYYEINYNTFENPNTFVSKSKINVELKNTLDPYNYNLNYYNKKRLEDNQIVYYPAYDQGPGRGFGNLNINNKIRLGESSRSETDFFKKIRETEKLERFDYIDNRFTTQNFGLPRCGEVTRKTASFNNNFNDSNTIDSDNIFNYNNFTNNPPIFNYNVAPTNNEIIENITEKNNEQRKRQSKVNFN